MMKIWCVVLVFHFLPDFGSTKPAEVINVDLSVQQEGIVDTTSYGSDTISYGLDTTSYGSDATSYGLDTTSYGSIFDNVKSSIYDVTSRASNLINYNSLINNNPFLSLSDKAQFMSQMITFSPNQLDMASDLFGMLGDVINAHVQWKLRVIRAAKVHFDLAMQALENGDLDAMEEHLYDALYTLPKMCPIYHALKYALDNDDFDMEAFVTKMGLLIMGEMELAVDVSV